MHTLASPPLHITRAHVRTPCWQLSPAALSAQRAISSTRAPRTPHPPHPPPSRRRDQLEAVRLRLRGGRRLFRHDDQLVLLDSTIRCAREWRCSVSPLAWRSGRKRRGNASGVINTVMLEALGCKWGDNVPRDPLYVSSSPQLNYTYLHTPPQRNLPRITHRFIHRPRVLHRHGVSAGARPGSLLRSGAEVVRRLPPCRCKKNEITEP